MPSEEFQSEIQELSETRRRAEQVVSEFQAVATAYKELLEELSKTAASAVREEDRGLVHKITSRLREFSAHRAHLLKPEDLRQEGLSSASRKSSGSKDDREAETIVLVNGIRGKYAFVPTSSDTFAIGKLEEIALEDRSR